MRADELCDSERRRPAGDDDEREHEGDTGGNPEHGAGSGYTELAKHLPSQRPAERRASRDREQQRRQQSRRHPAGHRPREEALTE